MLQSFKLLLPALIPSWNFFDIIAPSPRIQYALLTAIDDEADGWQEFRPRPQRLLFRQMLWRMVWNPLWNESLFLMSCAERLIEHPSRHSEDEILKRIAAAVVHDNPPDVVKPYLQFRLLLIGRQGTVIQDELVYVSRTVPLSGCTVQGDVT